MTHPYSADANLPLLATGAEELGLHLLPSQLAQFATFQHELLEWNKRVNLTSITAPEEIQVKHFLDSLTVLKALPDAIRRGDESAKLLDVGAGAGLPGIPLAIVCPNLQVTLLEATQKKCRFLDHVVDVLGLASVVVACGRAEELARRSDLRETFDVVVARAVAPLAVLAELCLPFVRVGGLMIASKKLGIDEEIRAARRAIETLGGVLKPPVIVRLPVAHEDRQLIVVEKVRPTPSIYPRRPGVPAKAPILG
jgi:16S rRNA (guanine527-N7)-methyltransferase